MQQGIMVFDVSKSEMLKQHGHPYFGYAAPDGRIIYIRVDLPPHVYTSVLIPPRHRSSSDESDQPDH
jgi:hypothetical protein